jgi:hypothetical protein
MCSSDVLIDMDAMGITVNIEDSKLLREPIDRARANGECRGRASAIEQIMRHRFQNHVPTDLADHLADLTSKALDRILQNSLAAATIEEALGSHMPAKRTA